MKSSHWNNVQKACSLKFHNLLFQLMVIVFSLVLSTFDRIHLKLEVLSEEACCCMCKKHTYVNTKISEFCVRLCMSSCQTNVRSLVSVCCDRAEMYVHIIFTQKWHSSSKQCRCAARKKALRQNFFFFYLSTQQNETSTSSSPLQWLSETCTVVVFADKVEFW